MLAAKHTSSLISTVSYWLHSNKRDHKMPGSILTITTIPCSVSGLQYFSQLELYQTQFEQESCYCLVIKGQRCVMVIWVRGWRRTRARTGQPHQNFVHIINLPLNYVLVGSWLIFSLATTIQLFFLLSNVSDSQFQHKRANRPSFHWLHSLSIFPSPFKQAHDACILVYES